MIDFDKILKQLSPENLKSLGVSVKKISDLYFSPIKTWKKIISNKNNSLNIFLFYFIIYGVMIYLTNYHIKLTIKTLLLNLLFTLQPFLAILLPFLFFRKIFKQNIQINRLFRLVFIFSIQIFPFLFIPIILAQETNYENFYIISDNAIRFVEILLIFVLPLLLKISIGKKTLWILTNYLFINLFSLFFPLLTVQGKDIYNVKNTISLKTPSKEYSEFIKKYNHSDLHISNDFFATHYKIKDDRIFYSPQFYTTFIIDHMASKGVPVRININESYEQGISNRKNKTINKTDNSEFIFPNKTNKSRDYDIKPLSKKTLDSLRNNFNYLISEDIKLTNKFRKSSKFVDNRKLYDLLFDYLNSFNRIYSDSSIVKSITKLENFISQYSIDNDEFLNIYKISNDSIRIKHNEIRLNFIEQYNKIEKSNIISKYLYYPRYKLFNKQKSIENFNKKFKNLSKIDKKY